jgi:hypothetical protein
MLQQDAAKMRAGWELKHLWKSSEESIRKKYLQRTGVLY